MPAVANKHINKYFWPVIIFCGLTIIFQIASNFNSRAVWDDAFMYVRYADNIINQGKASWNPGGEPTYGLTAPLYLMVVLPVRWLFPHNPALTAVLSSLISGLAFIFLLVLLLEKFTDTAKPVRRFIIMLVVFHLAVNINNLGAHFMSGMDTTFAMAYLTAYLIIASWHERSPGHLRSVIMGIWGGLAFFGRPDLLLYSLIVPVSMLIWASDKKSRKEAALILAVTLVITAAQILFAFYYFRSPLPLPFYVKSLKNYGDHIYKIYYDYNNFSYNELKNYFHDYFLVFFFCGISLWKNFFGKRVKKSSLDRGVLLATVFFLLYYYFGVLQIMFPVSRFYYPTLPALIFLACREGRSLVNELTLTLKKEIKPFSKQIWRTTSLFLSPFIIITMIVFARQLKTMIAYNWVGEFSIARSYKKTYTTGWFELDRFSSLPDDLVIATTEVGYPSAFSPRKAIIDLSGLNEAAFSHQPFSGKRFFKKYQPDLIYLPHRHYTRMIDEILDNAFFIEHYEFYKRSTLNDSAMGIALKKNSRYYRSMREIIEKKLGVCLPRKHII